MICQTLLAHFCSKCCLTDFLVNNLHLNLERGFLPAGGHLQLPPHPLFLLPHTLHECSYLIQPTYHTVQPMSLGMPNDNLKWQFHKKSPWKVVKWIANQINIFLIPAKNATFELFSFKPLIKHKKNSKRKKPKYSYTQCPGAGGAEIIWELEPEPKLSF